jgi:hypothetical protein
LTAEISSAEARRIALTAQCFNARDRGSTVDPAQLHRMVARLGLLQIDSVNVPVCAHSIPLFSRFGFYGRILLDRITIQRPRRFFEYWGHEASLLPIDCHPLLRWRMARARRGKGIWRQLEPFAAARRGEADALKSASTTLVAYPGSLSVNRPSEKGTSCPSNR